MQVSVDRWFVAAAAVAVTGLPALATASAFQTYGHAFRPIAMPANGPGSTGLFGDCLPDGRIVAVTGRSVLLESGAGSGHFLPVAEFDLSALPIGAGADPAFCRISPDGQTIAVGLGFGKPVAVVPVAALGTPMAPTILSPSTGTRYFDVPHQNAAWRNSTELALAAGDFGSSSRITLLDTSSPTGSPVNPTIIANIGGASGGIAFDSGGRLITGNGFDLAVGGGPSVTGTIKAFAPSLWSSAAADFESSGQVIGEVLSAASLVIDAEGNLVVGGGDFGSAMDTGYLGLISASALAEALTTGNPIDRGNPLSFRELRPTDDPFAFYSAVFNPATGELYATLGDFATGANTWYATIPAPGGLVFISGLVLAGRRRR